MKAAVLNAVTGIYDLEDIQIDKPRGREVLVQVKASGLCHSDLHMSETDFGIPMPAVFGHEISGIATELGPDVTEFAIGDHVVASIIQSCGHCRSCRNGCTYQCKHPEQTLRCTSEPERLTRNGEMVTQVFGTGGFAEYALIHENQLVKVPKELPFPQAAVLGCGTITGAGAAINTAQVRPGDTVVVLGAGGVGLNVIAGAKLAGAVRIIAIDMQAGKELLARKFGATDFLDASSGDQTAAVIGLTDGGADHVFEVIGLKSTSEQAIKMARMGGGAYLIGAHKPGATIDVDVLMDLIRNQVALRGVYMGSTNIKEDIPMYAQLYLQGRLNLDDLISKEINISEINEAYQELKQGLIVRSIITSF